MRKCKEKGSRVVEAEEEVTQLRITEAEEEEGVEMKYSSRGGEAEKRNKTLESKK